MAFERELPTGILASPRAVIDARKRSSLPQVNASPCYTKEQLSTVPFLTSSTAADEFIT
jgi:hypothetical protein